MPGPRQRGAANGDIQASYSFNLSKQNARTVQNKDIINRRESFYKGRSLKSHQFKIMYYVTSFEKLLCTKVILRHFVPS